MTLGYYRPTRVFTVTHDGNIAASDGQLLPGPLPALRCIVDATTDAHAVPQMLRRLADEIEHAGA